MTLCSCKTVHHAVHIQQATQDDLRNVVPDFAVEKTSSSSVAVTKQNGDKFSTFSVESLLRLLIALCLLHFDV